MFQYLDKKFILDVKSGICHEFSNINKNCQIFNIDFQSVFNSDSITEITMQHPHYKKKCVYCMLEHYY